MMKQFSSVAIGLIACVGVCAAAETNYCGEILRYSSHNVTQRYGSAARHAYLYNAYCSKEENSLSETEKEEGGAKILAFNGNYGKNGTSSSQVLKEFCSRNEQEYDRADENRELIDEIDHPAVEAWKQCNELFDQQLQVKPAISDDNKRVDIDLKYVGYGKSVRFNGIIGDGFSCGLVDRNRVLSAEQLAGKDLAIGNETLGLTCARSNDSTNRTATISVFSGGPTLLLSVPPVVLPPTEEAVAALKSQIAHLSTAVRDLQDASTWVFVSSDYRNAKGEATACPAGYDDQGTIAFAMREHDYDGGNLGFVERGGAMIGILKSTTAQWHAPQDKYNAGANLRDWIWTSPRLCKRHSYAFPPPKPSKGINRYRHPEHQDEDYHGPDPDKSLD